MYDERLVTPMREDLTSVGFAEMRTAAEVDAALKDSRGTVLVMVNSVCGCAAGRARPGVKLALQAAKVKPGQLTTVFAGQGIQQLALAIARHTGDAHHLAGAHL